MNIVKKIKYLKRKNSIWFKQDYKRFTALLNEKIKADFQIKDNYPIITDKFSSSWNSSGVYFHQDIYVAREIHKNNPKKHIDIGSRIDGFVAHLAVFREIEVFDIRPLNSNIKNVIFKQANLMSLNENLIDYCDSISSLHTIEHFGLGRYGDPINPNGHIQGFENILKIVRAGGRIYFSVPMGEPNRIEFNAHRVFSLRYLIDWLTKDCNIEKFTFIDDNFDLHEDVALTQELINNSCGCWHGCAIFVLKKL
jgi:Caenorhabditis protein of unknown function, DUF268.